MENAVRYSRLNPSFGKLRKPGAVGPGYHASFLYFRGWLVQAFPELGEVKAWGAGCPTSPGFRDLGPSRYPSLLGVMRTLRC